MKRILFVTLLWSVFMLAAFAYAEWDGSINFPGSLDTSTELYDVEDDSTIEDEHHDALAQAVIAVETKVGTGSDTAAAGEVFVGSGSGTSEWRYLKCQKQFTFLSPADADDCLLFKAQSAMTITDIHCIIDPADTGESISVNIYQYDSAGDNGASVDAAVTADNDGAEDDGSFSNGDVAAGDWVGVVLGVPSGTVSQLCVTIYNTEPK